MRGSKTTFCCHRLMIALVASSVVLISSCGGFGKVNQGRVVDYDPEKGTVTLIQDSNYTDPNNPKYDVLPPVTIKVPSNPKQMGPAPDPGKLLLLDSENKRVVFFDAASQGLRTVEYTLIEQRDGVFADDTRVAGKAFPVVDREQKSITVYSPRRRELVTFSVPDEYLALPDDTWRAGDEIRYYYKDPSQALRLMNITKTDMG